MASLLWGKVFYKDTFAGILQEEPGDRTSFTYDKSYLNSGHSAVSHTLPIRSSAYVYNAGLHPFFDNLVAEGWLEQAQTRLLGKRSISRFELLLAFGYDCAGAVSIIDPDPVNLSELLIDPTNQKEMAVLTSRASLSGIQPKLAIVEIDGKYYPAKVGELSTHIAKFPSLQHNDLIINEYLTTKAFKALLPEDDVVDLKIAEIQDFLEPALIIKRFDRIISGTIEAPITQRVHFEEFNQLLFKKPNAKYDGSYSQMSDFINNTKECLPIENYRLYGRILSGILLGNTDMHFKNFAMFNNPTGLRLTPSYDQVAAQIYNYKTVALAVAGARDIPIGSLKAKNLVAMAYEFTLSKGAIDLLIKQLNRHKNAAAEAIISAEIGENSLKDQLIKLMDARWNGTYALIGQILSKKP